MFSGANEGRSSKIPRPGLQATEYRCGWKCQVSPRKVRSCRILLTRDCKGLKSLRLQGKRVAFQEVDQGWVQPLKEITICAEPTAWPKPSALALDMLAGNSILPKSKEIAGADCKAFTLWSPSAAYLYAFLVPSKYAQSSSKSKLVSSLLMFADFRLGGFMDYEETVAKIFDDDTL